MMKKYEKIYQELRKTYSEAEIAESMLIPADLSVEEAETARKEMVAFRMKLLKKQSEEQRIYSALLRIRYQIEKYIEEEDYNSDKSFGNYLSEYTHVLKRTKKQLSEDLNIHYTRLSRIINSREEPNIDLIYRLEHHSGKLIPALLWWRLVIKKQAYEIVSNEERRKIQYLKVNNAVKFRA